MILTLIDAVYIFSELLIWIIMARCILSFFVRDPYSGIGKVYLFTIKLTEPIVSPIRNLMRNFNTGMFDFSLLIAFILIEVVTEILVRVLALFL